MALQNGRLAPAIIVGVRAEFEVIETSGRDDLAGIVIKPGGFSGLFGERADLCFGKALACVTWRGAGKTKSAYAKLRKELQINGDSGSPL